MIKHETIVTISEHTGKMRGMIAGNVFRWPNLDGLKSILVEMPWYKSIFLSLLFFSDVQYRFGLFVQKDEINNFKKEMDAFGKVKLIQMNYDQKHFYIRAYISPKIATAIRLAT